MKKDELRLEIRIASAPDVTGNRYRVRVVLNRKVQAQIRPEAIKRFAEALGPNGGEKIEDSFITDESFWATETELVPVLDEFASDLYDELSGWLESACTDMAYSNQEGSHDFGAADAEADDLFDDEDTISDLMGDRIFDSCGGHWVLMAAVAERFGQYASGPRAKVYTRKGKEWRKHAVKYAS